MTERSARGNASTPKGGEFSLLEEAADRSADTIAVTHDKVKVLLG
jgi:hypothetical protein